MHHTALTKLRLCADAETVAWLRRGIEANPNSNSHFALAAALTLLGRFDEARAAVRIIRCLSDKANPTYLQGRERPTDGMRIAGVRRANFRFGSFSTDSPVRVD
jgi:hypothetical protein